MADEDERMLIRPICKVIEQTRAAVSVLKVLIHRQNERAGGVAGSSNAPVEFQEEDIRCIAQIVFYLVAILNEGANLLNCVLRLLIRLFNEAVIICGRDAIPRKCSHRYVSACRL